MDEKYLVSVIVPIYKVEKYLSKCVDSILAQTYSNLEIILVDDGSPDRCGQICDEYASKDARIRVIHQENGGLSDARNSGMDIATGDFILFVDSDDWIEPEAVAVCIGEMTAEENKGRQVDVLYFSYYEVLEGKETEKQAKLVSPSYLGKIFDPNEFWIASLNDKHSFPAPVCFKFFRRRAIDQTRFVKGIISEDVVFMKSLHATSPNLVTKVIGTPLYNYIIDRAGSIMNQSSLLPVRLDDILSECYKTFKTMREKGVQSNTDCSKYLATYIVSEYLDYYKPSVILELFEFSSLIPVMKKWESTICKMPLAQGVKSYNKFQFFQFSPWLFRHFVRLRMKIGK